MATQDLTVGNNTYAYPLNNADPGYGEDAAAWAKAVTDTLTIVSGPYDISTTTLSITNNQATAASLTGILFSGAVVRSFTVTYACYRTTDSNSAYEAGELKGVYNGSAWEYSISRDGNSGIDLTVTTGGQVQYFSDDLTGTSYAGFIKLTAKTIDV